MDVTDGCELSEVSEVVSTIVMQPGGVIEGSHEHSAGLRLNSTQLSLFSLIKLQSEQNSRL